MKGRHQHYSRKCECELRSAAADITNPQTFGALQPNQISANAGPPTGQLALRLDF